LKIEEGGAPGGLVLAAGICSEGARREEIDIRRYAISLLHEFFKRKGRDLVVEDYRRMLMRIFLHIHRHVSEEWSDRGLFLDLTVMIATSTAAYAARSGGGSLFLFRGEEARPVFREAEDYPPLLGSARGEEVEVEEAQLQPGDIAVLCDPVVAKVIGPRDLTLILRRAADPAKASLFLSAIAERKGAESPLTALIWEVPNYQGAAMLTGDTPPAAKPEAGDTGGEEAGGAMEGETPAELAKKQWLSKWRRRKE
jgi:hypothetical protein